MFENVFGIISAKRFGGMEEHGDAVKVFFQGGTAALLFLFKTPSSVKNWAVHFCMADL